MTEDRLIYLRNRGDIFPGRLWVRDNVHDIPRRLQEIDSGYFVMFNSDNQKFELHHEDQDFTYCLTFPFDVLDGRAIDYALERRIERFNEIMRQMDENNRKVEEDGRKERDNQIECLAKDVHKFALRHDDDMQIKAFKEAANAQRHIE